MICAFCLNHFLFADTKTINSLRPYIIQKMGLENLGVQLSNLLTEYDLGLNLKYRDWETDRKSTRLNSSHFTRSRMPSSA